MARAPQQPDSDVTIVGPCFNEAQRLSASVFAPILQGSPRMSLLFVDDGSTDETVQVIERLVTELGARASLLSCLVNGGKAEAVRLGMRAAIDAGARVVGFYDADGATPGEEMIRLLALLEAREVKVAMASRVALLGREIRRKPYRHYLGRLFATAASSVLQLPVYDTQCGAKLFRVDPVLSAALEAPFLSRWVFDVELLGRLLAGDAAHPGYRATDFLEMPLEAWRDVKGSKLRAFDAAKVGVELVRIAAATRKRHA